MRVGRYPPDGTLAGFPRFVSNQVTAEEYLFGDLIIGQWAALEILVDMYTNSLSGTLRVAMFNSVDVAVRHPASFCHAHDGIV